MGLVVALGLMCALGRPALAADPTEVGLSPPEGLVRGIVYGSLGGSWHQVSTVANGELHIELTLQLPATTADAEPGPVVALWQFRDVVTDSEFGDVSERLIGPPIATAYQPNCDEAGNCAVRLRLTGSAESALEAADLEWVARTRMGANLTLVRTFASGALLQTAKPDVAGDGDGGTLDMPSDMFGALTLSAVFTADEAQPAEIPGDEFHIGRDDLYDWGAAVRDALADFVPPQSPEPVPIDVWMPERPDALRISLRLEFSDQCPNDRFLVFRDDRTLAVGALVYVGGARGVEADVALPLDGAWSIALQDGSGGVLNATRLQPLGTGTGLRISGPLRCSNGKGVFTQEGVPQIIASPSQGPAPTPESSPGSGEPSNPVAMLAAVIGGLAVVALAVFGFVRRQGHR